MANLHQGVAFSPQTTISENIGAADTIIKVSDSSVFPDPPNYATIGTDELGETIEYAAKAEGLLSGCTRGVEGTAKAWQKGDVIARNFTAKDHNDMISAVTTAQQTANTAASAATAAQSSADSAQSAADNAQSTANAAKTTAEAALPKSGGVMTGPITGITVPTVDTGAASKLYVDSNIVRPNLLDTWYFGNPVNQRGLTTKTGTGYMIDRWKSLNTDITTSLIDDYLQISTTGDYSEFCQNIEFGKKLAGKTVTVSILYQATGSARIYFYSSNPISQSEEMHITSHDDWTLFEGRFTIPDKAFATGALRFNICPRSKATVKIKAVKIELGSTQTLAHKEGDTWVLNEIPDYATELLKCQRYFKRLERYEYWLIDDVSDGFVGFVIPNNIQMRSIPAITNLQNMYIGGKQATQFAEVNVIINGCSEFRIRAFLNNHGISRLSVAENSVGPVFLTAEI